MKLQRLAQAIASFALAIALFGLTAGPAAAETAAEFYKGKVVKLVVGYGPGGGYDSYARLLAPFLEQRLGATVVVENRPGGGGMVAISQIAADRGDSLTLVLANLEAAALGQILDSPGIRFDVTELPVVARVAGERKIALLSAESPFRDLADLRAAERPVKWGGGGKTDGIADNAAVLSQALDLNAEIIIGYKGSKEVALAALRGEVDGFFASAGSARKLTAKGQLLAVAVLDRERSPLMPAVPTVFELVDLTPEQAWWVDYRASLGALGRSLIAAPGIPADRLAYLRDVVVQVLTDPAVVAEAEAKKRPLNMASHDKVAGLIAQTVSGLTAGDIERLRDVVLIKYY
ncbi:MAG: tripartite tricarboxylate transporter substrate-binding protein [Kiloniellaceae bacterium]